MKKSILLFLPLFLFLAGAFVSCEEVKETTKYDNWRERNEMFIDSIKALTGDTYVSTEEQARNMEVGKLYAIQDLQESYENSPQYIYCKKLTKNNEGRRPLYTESVSAFYYGTLITGEKFEGNFIGYTAANQKVLDGAKEMPNGFDSSTSFSVTGVISGWTSVLQYMRTGERWMVYIPWQCAYGSGGSGSILGYTTLTFDMVLESVK